MCYQCLYRAHEGFRKFPTFYRVEYQHKTNRTSISVTELIFKFILHTGKGTDNNIQNFYFFYFKKHTKNDQVLIIFVTLCFDFILKSPLRQQLASWVWSNDTECALMLCVSIMRLVDCSQFSLSCMFNGNCPCLGSIYTYFIETRGQKSSISDECWH